MRGDNPMTERYPPVGVPESHSDYQATRSVAMERRPWSPAQLVSITLGIVFVVLGGVAIARTGVDVNRLTGEHVSVAGSTQTQLAGYVELAYGASLLAVGSIP